MGDEAAECSAGEFEGVGDDVGERLGLGAREGEVNESGDDSDQCAVKNEAGFDAAACPKRSEKARDKGARPALAKGPRSPG